MVGFNPVVYVAEEEMGEDLEVCIEIFTSGNPNPVELLISTAEASATGIDMYRILLHIHMELFLTFSPAPEDYEPLNNRLLTFPAQSMMGDTACTNIVILNDDIPETPPEMFFANIMSDDADIEIGRSQANITLQDTGDTGIVFFVIYSVAIINYIQDSSQI